MLSLVVLVLVGWSGWNVLGTNGGERAGQGRAHAPPDSLCKKAVARVFVRQPGTRTSATSTVAVGSNLPGKVARVFVRQAGDFVKEGDPLFQLDDWAVRAELEVKKADLRLAEQQLAWLAPSRQEAGTLLQKDLEVARAALAEMADGLERAKRSRHATPPQELVKRKLAVAIARSNVEKAEAHLRLFVLTWKQDTAIAQARVDQAQRAVEKVRADLKHLTVTAPRSGVVLEVNVRVGETVTNLPGQVLVRLGEVSKL
jgi:multidrug resistance efflux pump